MALIHLKFMISYTSKEYRVLQKKFKEKVFLLNVRGT